MHRYQVGIIVLAAGASTRMGTPKQLIKINGRALICRAVTTAIETGARPVVVVLGANEDVIQEELKGLNFLLAINSRWQDGLASSIRTGLSALLSATTQLEGVLLMLADQPEVGAKCLDKILEAQSETNAQIVAAQCNDGLGTPAYFSRHFFGELLALTGAGGAKKLFERHPTCVLAVEMPEAEHDLDTPEDVAAFLRQTANDTSSPALASMEAEPSLSVLCETTAPLVSGYSRRQFIANVAMAGVGLAAAPAIMSSAAAAESPLPSSAARGLQKVTVKLRLNGSERTLQLDPRVTLLDALREKLDLTGTKKGCDHGQCGACTVLVNGRRINSCLALAVVHDGDEVTTIEGLAKGADLHPMQAAFLATDGFQCGYCTPGQICSAVALIQEGHAGSDAEIREWMSGNICRCGAYLNIVAAIREAKSKTISSL